jgi:lipopolysaccharide transport system permease protein
MKNNLLREIIQRRSLVWLFAINDVKLRYRNSVLGFLWTFLEPMLMLSVLYLVFTNIIKSDIENYALYLLLGLILWYMFSRATSMGLSSLVDRAGIIQKIYFRRELVVISSCLSAFLMMVFEFGAFVVFLGIFNFIPPITALVLPLILLDLFVLSLGLSLLLSSLYVYFRDIKFIWQVALQAGFFVSPIIYQMDMIPENIRWIVSLNPMVPILNTAHDAVLYGILPNTSTIFQIIISTIIIFVLGFAVFKIKDKRIVEAL